LLLVGGVSFGLAWLGRSFNVAVFVGLGQYLGLSLMLGGLVLRQWAILVLGRHFSTTVSLEADHRLVQHGPYRFLRHPAYTGSFMTMVGLQVALGNLGSTVLVIIILLGALMYRIKIEEEHLLTTFGEQYQRYMRRTWRLWPGL
jgi:protein-S-isoprenylcysteine O-methyltransferase